MVKIMENPIKMDDLGVPLFLETPIYSFPLQTMQHDVDRVRQVLFGLDRQSTPTAASHPADKYLQNDPTQVRAYTNMQ